MTPAIPSKKFLHIYDSLPPESQRKLIETHLGSVFDALPQRRAKRVIQSAVRYRHRQAAIPIVDYRAKRRELDELLADLARDAKCATARDRSNRDELMAEVVHSISTWICAIWNLVYEHRVQFQQAHESLLFIAGVLKKLEDGSKVGGCQCATQTYEVVVDIRNKDRVKVRRFEFHGLRSLNRVLLWTWREVFVSMSVSGGPRARRQMSAMLDDVDDELGWRAIARILYGGETADGEGYGTGGNNEPSEDEWEDVNDEDEEYPEDDDLDSQADASVLGKLGCSCNLHANHWSAAVNRHRLHLRRIIKHRLENLFALAPSRDLYLVLRGLSSKGLLDTLSANVANSSDNLAAALDIYAEEDRTKTIMYLLDHHSHLLRPRDSGVLQMALVSLAHDTSTRIKALAILEREMGETIDTICAAIRGTFCRIDDPKYIADLNRILKMGATQDRAERIERWLDEVITPSAAPLHAVAFAAMMMGIPAPGLDDGEDSDFLGHLDLNPDDPVMQDLREELRPPLAERFEGWSEVANEFKGSSSTLNRVYNKMVQLMPFLRATDVSEGMHSRISDRPSKRHVGDALATLTSFATVHRKKAAMRADKKKRVAVARARTPVVDDDEPPPLEAMPPAFTFANAGFSFSVAALAPMPPPQMPPGHPTFGGIDDVD